MTEDRQFDSTITDLAASTPRFRREAYLLIFDGIAYAHEHDGATGHLSAAELVKALLAWAGQEYGVLAPTVLAEWGVQSARDIGELVYNLIGVNLLAASAKDSLEDFLVVSDWFVEEENRSCGASLPLPKID